MSEHGDLTPPAENIQQSPETWHLSNKAEVLSSDGSRPVIFFPTRREVLGKDNKILGSVISTGMQLAPGETTARITFSFTKDPQGEYRINREGHNSWASALQRPGAPEPRVAGMRTFDKSLGGKTSSFYEPGPSQEVPEEEGVSFGMINFRHTDTAKLTVPGALEDELKIGKGDFFLGVIPDFVGTDMIRYTQDKDDPNKINVTVEKKVEGNTQERKINFNVFTGQGKIGDGIRYTDLVNAYAKELSSIDGQKAPLMHERVIGFSWPVYGPGVTETDIRKEIAAGKDILTDYIIDDGWETASGSLEIDKEKFPDLQGLAREIKDHGMKPGIWTAPFMIKEPAAGKLMAEYPDWFMKDESGKPMRLPIPLVRAKGGSVLPNEKPYVFDISNPEFRKYLVDKYTDLAGIGFDVFKADFLAVPFMGSLQNTDKSPTEYYRQVFQEIRDGVRERTRKDIELIGSGAPLLESIGLFNGMRMTFDSAMHNLEGTPGYGKAFHLFRRGIHPIVSKANTAWYRDAFSTSAKRALPYNGALGTVLDGIHLNDPGIPMDEQRKKRYAETTIAYKRLGIDNLFVGDSLDRIGEKGRAEWRDYTEKFKQTPHLDLIQ